MAEYGAPTKLTRTDLLALLRRNFSADWIEGLLADPSSSSIFEGIIAVALRVQDALDDLFYSDPFVLTAFGARRSQTTVRLTRPSGSAVTITDERFIDQRGAMWHPAADYTIPLSGGVQTVDVPIESDRYGDWLNFATPLTFRIFDDLPDANLVVIAGEDPAIDGKSPSLDLIGAEYARPRNPGESDSDYASRIRFLEDQVSPIAMADGALWMLDRYPAATQWIADLIDRFGLRALLEPFVDTAQPSYRNLYHAPLSAFADAVEGGAEPGTYTGPWLPYMTFADDVHGHWLRSLMEVRAWFDMFIPTPTGTTAEQAAAISALADTLDRIRAGGVGGRIVVGEPVFLLRHPEFGTLTQAGTWVNQGGLATDIALVEALETFDADDTYVRTATGEGTGTPLDAGDLLFTFPADALPPAPTGVVRIAVNARVRRRNTAGSNPNPILRFLVKTSSEPAAERSGSGYTIDHDDWRWYSAIFEVNPNTGAALAPGDVQGGTFGIGVANIAAAGATEELDVSELYYVTVLDYG